MKKILLSLILLFFLIFPNIILAAGEIITGMVENVTNIIVFIGTILVVIFFIITGILFLTAQGAPEKLSLAKKALFASIAGTAIVILAQVAKTIIENALFLGI